MRIFSGSAKNREVTVPKGVDLRPSEGQVRQAAFNIWGPGIEGLAFIDLFCGSGSVGLEALSRGVGKVVFVDIDGRCLKSVTEHADHFGFAGRYETLRSDALAAIKILELKGQTFDLIFIDPPYELKEGPETITALEASKILAPGARVLYEHSRRLAAPKAVAKLALWRQHNYGESCLSHYRLQAEMQDAS